MFSQGIVFVFTLVLTISNGLDTQWRVLVYTSDVTGASTNTVVKIKIIGTEGKSKAIALDSDKDNFETDSVDEFLINTANIGAPKEINVWSDDSGDQPDWHLARIELERTGDVDNKYIFSCDCWLSSTHGDKQLERTLPLSTSYWEVWVYTSDIQDAGSNAYVSIEMFGEKGHTRLIPLDNAEDNFERGKSDLFRFWSVDIGMPTMMRVKAANDQKTLGWHLDKIELENMHGADTYTFKCNCWFDLGNDAGETVKDLTWT